jgi:LAS superfamily LD-carboxypeptidase LdcB
MNLIVTIWRRQHNVITASVTDGEAYAWLKKAAEDQGYTVRVPKDAERETKEK